MTSAMTLILVTGMMPIGSFAAQDAPAAKPSSPPAATAKSTQTPAAKSAQGATAKPGQGSAAKKPGSATPLVLKTPKDKTSYAIGLNIGKSLHHDAIDVDPAIVVRGLKDALAGGKTLLTDEEVKAAMTALQGEVRKRQEAQMEVAGEANKKEGDEFLAVNKSREGVTTLPDGLQYKILKSGSGAKPTASDSVVCNYRGTLINGTEFDSSYKRGQPATFPVGGVIKGWTEVLQLMPVGSKWEVYVPSDLGYGTRGAGGAIGPNSTLIFEIELLSIQGK
jgi:FKBP-type peptidyl-prolyl cis-trans isomerase FklB